MKSQTLLVGVLIQTQTKKMKKKMIQTIAHLTTTNPSWVSNDKNLKAALTPFEEEECYPDLWRILSEYQPRSVTVNKSNLGQKLESCFVDEEQENPHNNKGEVQILHSLQDIPPLEIQNPFFVDPGDFKLFYVKTDPLLRVVEKILDMRTGGENSLALEDVVEEYVSGSWKERGQTFFSVPACLQSLVRALLIHCLPTNPESTKNFLLNIFAAINNTCGGKNIQGQIKDLEGEVTRLQEALRSSRVSEETLREKTKARIEKIDQLVKDLELKITQLSKSEEGLRSELNLLTKKLTKKNKKLAEVRGLNDRLSDALIARLPQGL